MVEMVFALLLLQDHKSFQIHAAVRSVCIKTKVPKVHPQTKTMLFDPKCMIFEHTSMFKNLEFLRIFIDFNEIFRFS